LLAELATTFQQQPPSKGIFHVANTLTGLIPTIE
jgi:hypothetical protein